MKLDRLLNYNFSSYLPERVAQTVSKSKVFISNSPYDRSIDANLYACASQACARGRPGILLGSCPSEVKLMLVSCVVCVSVSLGRVAIN